MRLIVYLVISTMAIVGMPFHFFFNWIGNNDIILQGISATIWLSVILILSLYILRKMSLETAYLATVTSFQVLTSVRIVYLAATATAAQLPLYKELILINEVMTLSTSSTLVWACCAMAPPMCSFSHWPPGFWAITSIPKPWRRGLPSSSPSS